jgi:hypothetical protein
MVRILKFQIIIELNRTDIKGPYGLLHHDVFTHYEGHLQLRSFRIMKVISDYEGDFGLFLDHLAH